MAENLQVERPDECLSAAAYSSGVGSAMLDSLSRCGLHHGRGPAIAAMIALDHVWTSTRARAPEGAAGAEPPAALRARRAGEPGDDPAAASRAGARSGAF